MEVRGVRLEVEHSVWEGGRAMKQGMERQRTQREIDMMQGKGVRIRRRRRIGTRGDESGRQEGKNNEEGGINVVCESREG